MGVSRWYEEHVLARLITYSCGQEDVTDLRREVVPLANGQVLELGCGAGFNQALYRPDRITGFAGIDPNAALRDGARRRAREAGIEADIREGRGEAIPFGDGAFDTIVCTFTLCTVSDQAQVLSEVRRVLKPGGRLLFLEHGRAPHANVARWQRRIEPVWRRAMGNCHLTREIGTAIRRAGFEVEPIGQNYLGNMPRWAGWMEWGAARRAGV